VRANQYREAIRGLPCYFCGDDREGFVSWHHLLCIGQHGKGMKAPPWATIPVCSKCHSKCHSYEICRNEQIRALLDVWLIVGEEECGQHPFWTKMGEAYWDAIGGN